MTYFKRHKYYLTGLLLIVLMFAGSVYLRKERLEAPLNRHHEWITAHTLLTVEIWSQNGGPSAYSFNPVYTYPGEGNHNTRMLGGVQAEDGNIYYVSYPPFAFIFAYYFTEMIGGPTVFNMRVLSLFLHLMCALLIFSIVRRVNLDYQADRFQIAGVLGAFLYLFSTGNLWIHGNLYFSDMLEQLFFLLSIYITIRYLRSQYTNEKGILVIIGIVFFLASYTEWLGLFISFFAGLLFFVLFIIYKQKRFLKPFVIIALSSGLALSITIFQYSSIVDFETFKAVSLEKYEYRSGHQTEAETNNTFNMHSDEAYFAIEQYLSFGFKMVENFIGISVILLAIVLVFRKFREKMKKLQWRLIAFILVFLSILTHYYLFFNFNAIHDFSTLKTGALMILLVSFVILTIEEALNFKLAIAFGIALIPLSIYKGIQSYEKYEELFPMEEVDYKKIASAEKIRQLSHPDIPVYVNTTLTPVIVFYAKHNLAFIKDTSFLPHFMNNYKEDQAQYYHHNGTTVEYMLDLERNAYGEIEVVDKLFFYNNNDASNMHHFQK